MINMDTCGALVKQLNDELERRANNAMRSHGITMTQCVALLALDEAPDGQLPLKEVEHSLRVAQSTAAGIVRRLEQKGLVETFSDPADARAKIARVTDIGRQHCRRAELDMQRTEELLLGNLSTDERATLLRLLRKVRDAL